MVLVLLECVIRPFNNRQLREDIKLLIFNDQAVLYWVVDPIRYGSVYNSNDIRNKSYIIWIYSLKIILMHAKLEISAKK